jgi:DNA mismatch repair protein MutS
MGMAKRTMMDQHAELKAEHPDTVLFFRMGDFYELFHDDAEVGAEVLGLTLTARDKSSGTPIPMAGFPWHQIEEQLRIMLRTGRKVAVAEQEEELREGAKLLERVVTRVYTPGSLYEEGLLETEQATVLAVLVERAEILGLAVLDAASSSGQCMQFDGPDRWSRLQDELLRWAPRELVVRKTLAGQPPFGALVRDLPKTVISQHTCTAKRAKAGLTKALGVADLGHLDLDASGTALEAAGLGVDYLTTMLHANVALVDLDVAEDQGAMVLDRTTLRNLEVISTLAGEHEGSLLAAVGRCRTAMGRRRLKAWLLRPLNDLAAISARHDAVLALSRSSRRLEALRVALTGMRDLERLATLSGHGRANARDLVATAVALERLPAVERACNDAEDHLLKRLAEGLTTLDSVADRISRTLVDAPPLTLREGGLLRDGVDVEVDRLRAITGEGTAWFQTYETNLRESLSIPSLKVRQNRQIGWFIEVTRTHLEKVPETFTRKQQMTNGMRFVTEELIERDDALLTATTRVRALEYERFVELRRAVAEHARTLSLLASRVASIDVLHGFSVVARERRWTRPTMVESGDLVLEGARHPVLERNPGYVPNDLRFDKKRRLLLITGPNMGGKSTYLRTAALVTLLAQAGSFTPCDRARVGMVDRIFTRVGASDDLLRGRSTFMMEMIEVAHILRRATPNSLVLLDEIGRGTSTFDGLSIAWAVSEDIARRLGCRTLFATHYHQLIGLEGDVPGVVNVSVGVAEVEGTLRFLHTVEDGPCDDSYGVRVAALAGLPQPVIERAGDLLQFLERQAEGAKAGGGGQPGRRDQGQSSLMRYFAAANTGAAPEEPGMSEAQSEVLDAILTADIDGMSPRDAADFLATMHDRLKEESDD